MRPTHLLLIIISLFLIFMLAACSLPAPASPTPENPVALYTAAAQTIMAQLTEAVGTSTPVSSEVPPTGVGPSNITPTQAPETGIPSSPTPSETFTVTPEASPTPTDTPTPTELPSDPRVNLGNPNFSDTFKNGANWSLYEDQHVSFSVNNNTLKMVALNPEHWDGFMLSWPVVSDSYLEMKATSKNCSGLDRYGLVVRSTNTDKGYTGYLFGISCDGRYSLRSWDGEEFTTLINWTESEFIKAGSNETNRIGFWAKGANLSFYANGNLLGKTNDNTYKEGKFGVFIGSINTQDFTVRVDEINQWDLP